jgi:hypothetical protein
MLNLIDQLIERVLDTGWTPTPPPTKPGFYFTVPDEDWLARVHSGNNLRLNIYMYEVRENRDMRRAPWDVIEQPDRTYIESHAPVYFDCHYLLSAWSPEEDSEATSPVLTEHQMLAETLRVLLRNPDVIPAALGFNGGPVFQQSHIYLTVAPPEAPRVLNDFWSTMKLPWRPAIQLIATAPLDLLQDTPPGPPMTTFIQRYAALGPGGTVDEWIQMGGWVLRDADSTPIAGATVQRVVTGETATTDTQGRYIFTGLRRGIHRLQASAPGFTSLQRDLDIPTGPPADHIFRLNP